MSSAGGAEDGAMARAILFAGFAALMFGQVLVLLSAAGL